MDTRIETDRLLLSIPDQRDLEDYFEMDSDPEVHRFIDNQPVQHRGQIEAVIGMLQEQFHRNGTARLSVRDKQTGECLGWCGLKYFGDEVNGHSGFYELGYRFKRRHWGKGYATESALAVIHHGFQLFQPDAIYAMTHPENQASGHVLTKLGFELTGSFLLDGDTAYWFTLTRENWENRNTTA